MELISNCQRKGALLGAFWSLGAWIPFYTNYLGALRKTLGLPAILGINLELALNSGDAFVYSILLGLGLGFFFGTLLDNAFFFLRKKHRFIQRGL